MELPRSHAIRPANRGLVRIWRYADHCVQIVCGYSHCSPTKEPCDWSPGLYGNGSHWMPWILLGEVPRRDRGDLRYARNIRRNKQLNLQRIERHHLFEISTGVEAYAEHCRVVNQCSPMAACRASS